METFPELASMSWVIEEVPEITQNEPVRRFSANPSKMEIVLYRIPIQRMGKFRISDPRMQIEQAVISAAAALIGKDPWELIHPN